MGTFNSPYWLEFFSPQVRVTVLANLKQLHSIHQQYQERKTSMSTKCGRLGLAAYDRLWDFFGIKFCMKFNWLGLPNQPDRLVNARSNFTQTASQLGVPFIQYTACNRQGSNTAPIPRPSHNLFCISLTSVG